MKTIALTVRNYRCFTDTPPTTVTIGDGFTAIVGPNNSGKSSFLKLLWENRALWSALAELGVWHRLTSVNSEPIGVNSLTRSDQIECTITGRRPSLELKFTDSPSTSIHRIELTSPNAGAWHGRVFGGTSASQVLEHDGGVNLIVNQNGVSAPVLVNPFIETFAALRDAMYVGPFRNAVNVGGNSSYYELSIGAQFIETWSASKGGPDAYSRNVLAQVVADLERIFGYSRLEVDASHARDTLLVRISGKSYPLSEMGSGFAQFLLLMAQVALRRPSMLLIDEPELHLHPRLQADFLTTLASYTTTGNVVFATHALGLARSVGDRVYSLHRSGDVIDAQSFEYSRSLAEFLGEMSYAGLTYLGYKTVLLVEGPSEFRAIPPLLRTLGVGTGVALLPLGGSTLIRAGVEYELAQITSLANKVYALIDSERSSRDAPLAAGRQAFLDQCNALGISAHVTDRRAFDNYLSDRAVKRVKGESFRGLEPFERLADLSNGWAKADNGRIAQVMTRDEILDTDVGRFLRGLP